MWFPNPKKEWNIISRGMVTIWWFIYTPLEFIFHDKRITFTDEPHVHMVGKVGMVHAGEMLHLNCTATGIPKPDISWYMNKKKLQKSKNSRNFTLEMKFYYKIHYLI